MLKPKTTKYRLRPRTKFQFAECPKDCSLFKSSPKRFCEYFIVRNSPYTCEKFEARNTYPF